MRNNIIKYKFTAVLDKAKVIYQKEKTRKNPSVVHQKYQKNTNNSILTVV